MCKVFFSVQARNDLFEIQKGLMNWKTYNFSFEYSKSYVNDIYNEALKLIDLPIRTFSTFIQHKQFGKFVYTYRRNKRTVWYFVYNIDKSDNIFVNRIFSNHNTQQ